MRNDRKLRNGENAFIWLMLAFSLFVLIMAYNISGFSSISSPGTFPMAVAAVMVVSTLILLINNRRARKPEAAGLKEELGRAAKDVFFPVFLIYTAIIIGYMIAIQPLHFLPSSLAFLLVSIIFLKGASPLKAILISVGTLGGIYLIFHYLFRVVLP
jgi:putative tricarboxylic transport membrane protein